MTQQFGTGTEMFVMSCECGHDVRFRHTGPLDDKATALALVTCESCGRSSAALMPGASAYSMRPDTIALQIGILRIFDDFGPPLTVREVFYQAEGRGLVPKDKSGVRRVQTQLVNMRRAGSVPYSWVADNSRYVLRRQTYGTLGDALTHWQNSYRRDLWQSQNSHVEVWVEKKALIGVLEPITGKYGVGLYPAGGYSSVSFAYEAAEMLKTIDKPVYIYHVGDFDADGLHAAETIAAELRRHGARFHFERLGVTWEQIQRYNLPTRPQKTTSPRYKWFVERHGRLPSCELDALPPNVLRSLVEDAIASHIDPYQWHMTEMIEREERQTLDHVFASLRGGEDS